mmetsp:Transcript_32692/g.79440  ORF Transcript_32692/g.79440 Transcript_32692/m.79440 type:complete len:451 (+) Transcript_32692:120-1472(+)
MHRSFSQNSSTAPVPFRVLSPLTLILSQRTKTTMMISKRSLVLVVALVATTSAVTQQHAAAFTSSNNASPRSKNDNFIATKTLTRLTYQQQQPWQGRHRRHHDSVRFDAMVRDSTTATSGGDSNGGPSAIMLFLGNVPRRKNTKKTTEHKVKHSSTKLSATAIATATTIDPSATMYTTTSWDTGWATTDNHDVVPILSTPKNVLAEQKDQNETDLREWSEVVHGLNVVAGILSMIAMRVVQSGMNKLPTLLSSTAPCLFFVQLALVCDHFITGFGKHFSKHGDSTFLRKIHRVRFAVHGLTMPMLMFLITGVAVSNGLLAEATKHILSACFSTWAMHELWHWTVGYDLQSMKLVDLRESKNHKGTYLAGTLNYTSGKVLQMLVPIFTVFGYQLWVGSRSMVGASRLSGVAMLLSALSSFAPHVARRPGLHVFGENLHIMFLAASSWLVAA